jgi:hypothetical protein
MKFHDADVSDSHPHLENSPRPSDQIMRDFAEEKIDFHFFDIGGDSSINKKMANVFQSEYDCCQARSKNFTQYAFTPDFNPKIFFAKVLHGMSKSVLSFVKRNKTSTLTIPLSAAGGDGGPKGDGVDVDTIVAVVNSVDDLARMDRLLDAGGGTKAVSVSVPAVPVATPLVPTPHPSRTTVAGISASISERCVLPKAASAVATSDWFNSVLPSTDQGVKRKAGNILQEEGVATSGDLKTMKDQGILTGESLKNLLVPSGLKLFEISAVMTAIGTL